MANTEEISAEHARYLDWVNEYQVYENTPEDLFELGEVSEQCVWTEVAGENDSIITSGYIAAEDSPRMPVISYYISRKPWLTGPEDNYLDVYASLLQDCEGCDASGEDDDGDECGSCDGLGGSWVEFELPKV